MPTLIRDWPEQDRGARRVGPGGDCLAVLSAAGLDIEAAVKAARRAEAILAAREHSGVRQAGLDGDDLMRRRQAAAEHEAAARRSAVRQDPAPRHHVYELDQAEPELEAGQ